MASNVAIIQYADDGTGTLLDPIPSALVAPEATAKLFPSNSFLTGWSLIVGNIAEGSDDTPFPGNVSNLLTDASTDLDYLGLYKNSPVIVGLPYIITVIARPAGYDWLQFTNSTGIEPGYINVNIATGETGMGSAMELQEIKAMRNGYYRVSVKVYAAATTSNARALICSRPTDRPSRESFVGVIGDGMELSYINMVQGSFVSPPITTYGVAVLRDKDGVILDNLNINATEGSIYFELLARQDTANLLDGFLSMTNGVVGADDGTNQASSAEVVAVDVESKVGMIWGPDGMQQCTDGVWSSLESYDGSLNDGVLDLFRDATASNQIRNLQLWNVSSASTIDGLMDG